MKTEDIIKNAIKGVWQLEKIMYPSGKVVEPPDAKTSWCITDEYIFISHLFPLFEGEELMLWCHVWRYKVEGTKITIVTELRGEHWADESFLKATDTQTHTTDVKLDGEKVEFKIPLSPGTALFDRDTFTGSTDWGLTVIWKRVERFN
ncbi:hypothetical protein FJZ31_09245 [Candidatus Poribacteria bacterium]|nr:hypothetical protein [Candidatus Poribacteria bacterium]